MQAFFTDRLISQRAASPNTIGAYKVTFRLLLGFASERTGKAPSNLDIAELDAPLISAFLDHLERDRHNSPATRNNRPATINSLFGCNRRTFRRHATHTRVRRALIGLRVPDHVAGAAPTPGHSREQRLGPRAPSRPLSREHEVLKCQFREPHTHRIQVIPASGFPSTSALSKLVRVCFRSVEGLLTALTLIRRLRA